MAINEFGKHFKYIFLNEITLKRGVRCCIAWPGNIVQCLFPASVGEECSQVCMEDDGLVTGHSAVLLT